MQQSRGLCSLRLSLGTDGIDSIAIGHWTIGTRELTFSRVQPRSEDEEAQQVSQSRVAAHAVFSWRQQVMYAHILVVTDGSDLADRALGHATAITKALNSER